MASLIAIIFALGAFTATIAGVNLWGAPADAPLNFDILSALRGLSATATFQFGMPEQAGWALGAVGLALPAIIIFYIVRGAFGGR